MVKAAGIKSVKWILHLPLNNIIQLSKNSDRKSEKPQLSPPLIAHRRAKFPELHERTGRNTSKFNIKVLNDIIAKINIKNDFTALTKNLSENNYLWHLNENNENQPISHSPQASLNDTIQ